MEGLSMSMNAQSWRARMTRMLLWVSVVAWGILLGGKLFDPVVLVGAWSANPPESLSLLPYGPRFPIDTGDYFFPSSVALLVCSFALFASGWRTPLRYRLCLFLPPLMLLVILIFTIRWFWPANTALWHVALGATDAMQDRHAIATMIHQWVAFDWIRIAAGLLAFLLCIAAISVPFPVSRGRDVT
ncbi:MAG: DUF1772 domain-containing protein [Gemmatimonadota bacterium]